MIQDGARHFEDMEGVVYLNSAAQGPLPTVSLRAIEEALKLKTQPYRVKDGIYFELPNRARTAVSGLIGARPEHVILGGGASHGMSVAALGLALKPGEEVVVATSDFPSNLYIWSQAAERAGAKAVLVRPRRHAATTDEILAAIGDRTRVVSVSWVDFGSGEAMDVGRLAEACKKRDIFLAVDGTQAVGIVPTDVSSLGANLVTVGAYKWMLGPYGTGFAWLDPEWWERIPPAYVTWTASQGAEEFNKLPREGWEWVASSRRYDAPETASFFNVTGLARSAEFLGELGIPAVHAHVTELLAHLEKALPVPFRRRATPSEFRAPILLIESDDVEAVHRGYHRLRNRGYWVSLREDGIRVSPHIFNTGNHIEQVLEILSE